MKNDDRGLPQRPIDGDSSFDGNCPRCTAQLLLKIAQHLEMLVEQPALKQLERETYFDPKIKSQMGLVQDMKDSASVILTQLSTLARQLEGERILPRQHTHRTAE